MISLYTIKIVHVRNNTDTVSDTFTIGDYDIIQEIKKQNEQYGWWLKERQLIDDFYISITEERFIDKLLTHVHGRN